MDNSNSAADKALVYDILKSTHQGVIETKADIKYIKEDLKEHMRRTAVLETELKFIHGKVNMARGAIAVLAVLLSIAGVLSRFVH